jgi:hypothetical protein
VENKIVKHRGIKCSKDIAYAGTLVVCTPTDLKKFSESTGLGLWN